MLRWIIEPDSKMEQLYTAIAEKKVQTDEDASEIFSDAGHNGTSLTSVKSKLKERLLDSFFLLHFKEANFTSRQKAFYECYKKWATVMTLLSRNAKVVGIDLLERLLRHTTHFEFTELTLDILRVLRLQYSIVDGDIKKYEAVKVQYEEYEAIWMMENKAEKYYSELMVQFTNSKSTQLEVVEQAKGYYAELAPFMEKCNSFKLHMFGRLVEMMIYNGENDYVNTARLCEDAIRFFDQKDYDSGLPLQVFYYNLIVCYLQLREFEKGQAVINRCGYYFEEGTFNWFKLQELFFLLATHSGHYEEAYWLYEKVVNYPRFEEKAVQITEMWKIYQAYLFFLIKIGKIPPGIVSGKISKFRITKFLNEISLFSKDKRGMNISVLIVQILHALAEKNYDQTAERIETIEKYCSRYLRDNDTFRSNCFIKMLLQIPLASFHREAVARKTDRYYKMLESVPLEAARQAHEIEIVPYEVLWAITVEALDLKIHKLKPKKSSAKTA
ncbi:MAG: hypothetical protein H6575_19725 [Lewinellaceae bacterium]|nr:hypothetical protein [Lewinellaceae bacterium]